MIKITNWRVRNLFFLCSFIVPFFLLGTVLEGCKSKSATERRYDLVGKVVSIDKAQKQITVAHEDIKGYMPGMVMPFTVRDDAALSMDAPGDKIKATLVVDRASMWLENVAITEEGTGAETENNVALPGEPKSGDEVPDFRLINQNNKPIHISQYKGKALLLTFIYTRCPVPEYCTLMSNNFAEIDKELRNDPASYDRTHLLSVSFDSKYDTPTVLKSYGAAHTGNYDRETFSHWEFATGTTEEVKGIAQFFGLRYFEDTDQIVHSLRTAVIDADGRIYKLYRGNDWKPAELLADVHTIFNH